MTVLSLLYKGRGAELDRVARLVKKNSMGGGVGMSTGGAGEEEAADGGPVGVALDGRLPSRKEIAQLDQLCFTKAAEVNSESVAAASVEQLSVVSSRVFLCVGRSG